MKPIRIAHLYPATMNIYGDMGNVRTLLRRLQWRKIEAEVINVDVGDSNLDEYDLIFMGGGQDRDQSRIFQDFVDHKRKSLAKAIDDGVAVLAVCGGYQLLGHEYVDAEGLHLEGLGLLDLRSQAGSNRWIGNVLVETGLPITPQTLVGFENHGGRTFLGPGLRPLGRVVVGGGNNGEDKTEGVIFKNVIGTYLHGSLLPKNPQLSDWLLAAALKHQGNSEPLAALDDEIELRAHRQAIKIAMDEK